jgi:transposase
MDHSTPSTFVGLDVHKETIAVAVLRPQTDLPEQHGIPNTPEAVRKLVRSWSAPDRVRVCYEAGPCGYAIFRQLDHLGVSCQVIAPALIPKRPGVRVKTDRRDARDLVRLYRAGELTAIRVPSEEEEAVRDLVRAREDMKQDILRARHRLSKFLLRHGRIYSGKAWSKAHTTWLNAQKFAHPALTSCLSHYRMTLDLRLSQLEALEAELERWAAREPFAETVGRLICLKGISTLSALTIACEICDFARFGSGDELAAFVGLVPSEHSSGGSERRGSITKTGNAHVRRVLVEASWHYRRRPFVGEALKKRSEGQPAEVLARAWSAQIRLNAKYRRLVGRGKRSTVAVVAVARELAKACFDVMMITEEVAA